MSLCFKTILTKNGELIQVIRISEFDPSGTENLGVEPLKEGIRAAIDKNVTNDEFGFWFHTIRRKKDLSLDHDSRSTSSNDDINSTTDNNSSSNNNDSNSDLSNTKPDLVLNVYSEAVPIYVKKSTNPKEQFGKTTETKERSEIKSEEDVKHGKYCVLS